MEPMEPTPGLDPQHREAALQRLRADWEGGRLSPAEHERRATLARRARNEDELSAALDGSGAILGEPGPGYASPVPPVSPAGSSQVQRRTVSGEVVSPHPVPRKTGGLIRLDPQLAGTIMGLTPLLALILFFTVNIDNSWLFFLAIPMMGILLYGASGKDEDEDEDTPKRGKG